MSLTRTADVLVAVEPLLLGSAIADVLTSAGRIVAVVGASTGHFLDRHYRAAIVSNGLPDGVSADVVVATPRDGIGDAVVTVRGIDRRTTLDRPADLLRLLDPLPDTGSC